MEKKVKAALIAAIEKHLGKHGPKDWAKVRDRFPDVPESTFWRIAKQVKERPASPEALTNARKRISARNRSAGKALPEASSKALASLSPAVVAKHGDDAFTGFDYLKEVGELYADAKQLRSFSLGTDGKIRNPAFFEKSIARREDILETAATLMERFFSIETNEHFYRILLEEIGAADKETQIRILKRLHHLQNHVGVFIPTLADF